MVSNLLLNICKCISLQILQTVPKNLFFNESLAKYLQIHMCFVVLFAFGLEYRSF